MLARIERIDGRLKSYATVMADQALASAKARENEIQSGSYRGPLHGVSGSSVYTLLSFKQSADPTRLILAVNCIFY